MIYEIEMNGAKHRLLLEPADEADRFRAVLDDAPCEADARMLRPGILSLLIGNVSYRILFDPRPGAEPASAIVLDEKRISYMVSDPRSLRSRGRGDAAGTGARPVIAPMPGRIVRLLVQAGDAVEAQQGLIVMEAMKMQNELRAPKAGRVARLTALPGTTVQPGEVLAVIE